MNFDQGAQNARGCGDVTRQWFLLLLCSFPPLPLAVWVGIMEKEAWEGSVTELGFKPPITDQSPSARLRKTASLTGYFWPTHTIRSCRARSSAEMISANINVYNPAAHWKQWRTCHMVKSLLFTGSEIETHRKKSSLYSKIGNELIDVKGSWVKSH